MSGEAEDLRELARDIYELVGRHRIAGVAWPAVQALCEYLTLRARVMELEARRNTSLTSGVNLGWDCPAPLGGDTYMNSQAKSAIRELKQSVERLNSAQSNPQQLQQLVQEIQQQVQKLEQQLQED